MNHFFFFLPAHFWDWAFLLISLSLLIVFYFWKTGREQEKADRQTERNVFLLNMAFFAATIFIELLLFAKTPFQSTAYDVSIILRMILVGFPILYCASHCNYQQGYRWSIIFGILVSLSVTHNFLTLLEVAILYSCAVTVYDEQSRSDFFGFLFRIANLFLISTPFLFAISFFMYPGSVSVRFDYAFTVGWVRCLAYYFTLLIAGFSFWLIAFVRKGSGETNDFQRENKSIGASITLRIIIYFVITLFLMTSSALWFFQRNSMEQTMDDAVSEIAEAFAKDYFFFFDMGKALIRSYSDELSEVEEASYLNRLISQINTIPYFDSLSVVDAGTIVVSYPGRDALVEGEIYHCQNLPAGEALLSLVPQATEAIYVFVAQVREGVCLLGTTSLRFSPQFDQYISLMDEFSTDWTIADQSGGYYYSDDSPLTDERASYQSGFFQEIEYTAQPLGLLFVRTYELDAVAEAVASRCLPFLLLLLAIHLGLLFLLVYFNRLIHQRLSLTFEHLTALEQLKPEDILENKEQESWFGLNQRLRVLANALKNQDDLFAKGLTLIDEINAVSTYSELKGLIQRSKFFKAFGNATLLIDPELTFSGMPHDKDISVPQYRSILNQAIEHLYKPFSVSHDRVGHEEKAISTFFPLLYKDSNIGFLVVTHIKGAGIRLQAQKLLASVAKILAATVYRCGRRAEDSLENERINLLVHAYPEPVIVLDKQLNLILINEAARNIPGLAAEQAVYGVPLRKLVRDQSLLSLITNVEKRGNTGIRMQLGNRNEYLVTVVSSENESDVGGWILVTLQDITQYQEQGQVRAELFESVAQYLQMPIKMTRGNLKMISMVGPLNESQRNYAENMAASIDDIDLFLRQMIERNRLQNPSNFDMKIVGLDDLLKEVVDRIVPYTQQQNVAIYLERSGDFRSRQIQIDPQLFSQAIFNLLENSVHHNHVGGEVQITVEEHLDHFVVCISDTGPGISAVDLNRIFAEPSVADLRGDSPKVSMGLQLAKSIIERHNGEVWVKSKLGQGSQFFIRIPRYSPTKMRNSSS